ncbi:hypothetical protein M5D96_008147 [Drosophila gunungcola]|uniref:Uncharacterized protein n=3 Tax=Drosophila gunungcola TaxID=103775 RepID=A0A9P9YLZ4_9MUSC|nr:hypothetical protein M5D96_008147 [Drosophila gunungcola]
MRDQSEGTASSINLEHWQPYVTSVTVNKDPAALSTKQSGVDKSNLSWTFLCSGIATICNRLATKEGEEEVAAEEKDIAPR